MRQKIRVLSIVIVILLIAGILPVTASAAEQDAWSKVNSYMESELRAAQAAGLIPDCVYGKDFTQPMTRAEFAHLIVLLCETYTGVTTEPHSPNPFKDIDDPVVFKAYAFGIMQGFGDEDVVFSPDAILDRETMALMFYRAVNLIVPLADYHAAEAPVIPDQESISGWAARAVEYLYSRGIVAGGSGGAFMPRPADAQAASDFGIATREQCVAVALRIYNKLPEIAATRFTVEDKAAEVMSYAQDEPQGGQEISRDDLHKILLPYSQKVRWANNLSALTFIGDYVKEVDGDWQPGYDSALLYNAFSVKGANQYKYDEEQLLWGSVAGRSRYALSIFDAKDLALMVYEWNDQSDEGVVYRAAMQSYTMFSPAGLTAYTPGRLDWEYRIFDDEIVNGELCKVFSVTWLENKIQGGEAHEGALTRDVPPGPGGIPEAWEEVTSYFYVSTITGLCVVQKLYSELRDETYQSIRITFNTSPSLTDAGEIERPEGITFKPYTQ